jgi:hypothetical protein
MYLNSLDFLLVISPTDKKEKEFVPTTAQHQPLNQTRT